MRFVLDASTTLTWLLRDAKEADRRAAQAVLDALKRPDALALVPATWSLEVANVLARGEARERVTEAQSEAFLEMLAAAPIQLDDASPAQALNATLQLARRHRLSAYDASYLELALRTGLPIATLDGDLGKAAEKAGVKRFPAA